MPTLNNIKRSLSTLTVEEAVEVVRQTRRDRVAYVAPKKPSTAKKKTATTGTRKPRAAGAVAKPRAKRTVAAKPTLTTAQLIALMTPAQRQKLMEGLEKL